MRVDIEMKTDLMPTLKMPSVGIVIAVFNAKNTIEKCLKSCFGQTYLRKKIYVIDGGSTDGTKNILSKYSSKFAYWESRPDHGIYHAWNKALRVVDTEWIVFLGADDQWYNSSSLSKIMTLADFPAVNFVSAKVYKLPYQTREGHLFGEAWEYYKMRWRMNIGHTGMLHHASLFDEFGYFDESYRIAGDYEFLLRAGQRIRAGYLSEPIVLMGGGGVSSANLKTVRYEGYKALIQSSDFSVIYGWIFFLRFTIRHFWRLIKCN
jgi:glycosyltransferase involved in cell wall biosynthesis